MNIKSSFPVLLLMISTKINALPYLTILGYQDIYEGGAFYGMNAVDISGNGSTVVGNMYTSDRYTTGEVSSWSLTTGVTSLGFSGIVGGISADESIITGTASDNNIFRYTSEGLNFISIPNGISLMGAGAANISADGSTIAGQTQINQGTISFPSYSFESYIWTENSGVTFLPDINGNTFFESVISGDGTILAGWSDIGSDYHAFQWSEQAGFTDLGTIPDSNIFGHYYFYSTLDIHTSSRVS